jgi:hypothetical protein
MSETFLLVPDRSALKQVHGSLLVGQRADGSIVPVAIDDEGRIIATGSPAGTDGGFDLKDAPVDRPNFPDNEPAPLSLEIIWLRAYRDGTPSISWDPDDHQWIAPDPTSL